MCLNGCAVHNFHLLNLIVQSWVKISLVNYFVSFQPKLSFGFIKIENQDRTHLLLIQLNYFFCYFCKKIDDSNSFLYYGFLIYFFSINRFTRSNNNIQTKVLCIFSKEIGLLVWLKKEKKRKKKRKEKKRKEKKRSPFLVVMLV